MLRFENGAGSSQEGEQGHLARSSSGRAGSKAGLVLARTKQPLPQAHLVRVTVVLLMSYCFFHLAAGRV